MLYPRRNSFVLLACVISFAIANSVRADVDNLITLVDEATGTGGRQIGTYAYDAATQTFYVAGFGAAGAAPGNPILRKVTGVFSGTPTPLDMVSEVQLQFYYRDGDPTRAANTLGMSGFLLNPQQIVNGPTTYAPYSFAVFTDFETTGFPSPATGTDPAASKRVYTYNLNPVASAGIGQPPIDSNGNPVFTTRATITSMQSALGGRTGTTTNTGRQFAWSGDGQSIYFADSSNITTAVGGIWKMGAVSGTPERILPESVISEPAVLTSGSVDSIYFAGGGTTSNSAGIDKITHNTATNVTSARTIAYTAAQLSSFLELPAGEVLDAASFTSDSAGNLYFNNTDSPPTLPASPTDQQRWEKERRGIYRIDPQGRMSKVVSFAERRDEFGAEASTVGSINSNTLRMQTTTVSFNNGVDPAFNVPMVMYTEASGVNFVAGAYGFKPGDFNRDNTLDADDIALFKPQLTTRGPGAGLVNIKINPSDWKFDMNGNSVVDWKDVKVLQPFADLSDGDIDLNGVVDMADYAILQANWMTSGKTYIQGDLSGDDLVNLDDYNLWAVNAGQHTSSVITGATFVGIAGDFDLDLDVDGADFVVWQTHFPWAGPASISQGDADGDGDIDGADFVVWQTNFPKTLPGPPGSPGVVPVPEPAAGGLAIAAVGCITALQLRRRKQS